MRVPFFVPSENDFNQAFLHTTNFSGGALGDIRVFNQRGGSFFGVLSKVVRNAIPFLRSIILPEIGSLTKNITEDCGNHKPFKESLRANAISSGRNVARKILGGRKKKKQCKKLRTITRKKYAKTKKKPSLKPTRRGKNDIFERSLLSQ